MHGLRKQLRQPELTEIMSEFIQVASMKLVSSQKKWHKLFSFFFLSCSYNLTALHTSTKTSLQLHHIWVICNESPAYFVHDHVVHRGLHGFPLRWSTVFKSSEFDIGVGSLQSEGKNSGSWKTAGGSPAANDRSVMLISCPLLWAAVAWVVPSCMPK